MDHPPGVGIPGSRRGDRGEIERRSREELPTIKGIGGGRRFFLPPASCFFFLDSRGVARGLQWRWAAGTAAAGVGCEVYPPKDRKTPTTTEKRNKRKQRGVIMKRRERGIWFPFPC
ncbi:hypothetical protein BHM03_00058867 [Ensete ventricosum]|nr:hypothetical protein BHM03_00058867 [Ensete ventricosum]